MTHTELVNAVLEAIYLTHGRQACVQKINTMAARAGDRYIASANPGTADILGIVRGLPVAIECKVGKDKQSTKQKIFERAWTHAGGCYIVGRTTAQVVLDIDKAIEEVDHLIARMRRPK